MVFTLKSLLEQAEANERRLAKYGHLGPTPAEAAAIERVRALRRKWAEEDRLQTVLPRQPDDV